ncbi:MAG: HPr family phosphocarrier protein [Syntrophales bacterium]|nr:HPr family phosphocarrier protein [Syntrophales bacterium]
MVSVRSFEVRNRLGIHARVAAKIVETVARFRAKIVLEYEGQEVNAKSILGILTLACPMGAHVSVRAQGPDAEEALDALATLFAERFGED